MGIPFSQISSIVLLLIIYATFCDTFSGMHQAIGAQNSIAPLPQQHIISVRLADAHDALCIPLLLNPNPGNVEIEAGDLLKIVIIIVLIQGAEIIAVFVLSNRLQFKPADTVCAVFCATHKSLTLGMSCVTLLPHSPS